MSFGNGKVARLRWRAFSRVPPVSNRMNVGQTVQAGDAVGEVVQVHAEGHAVLLKSDATQRTQWYFAHELAPVERSVALAPERFPKPLQTFRVHASDTSNENLVIFLHGLGDTHAASFALGQAMALPQTGRPIAHLVSA